MKNNSVSNPVGVLLLLTVLGSTLIFTFPPVFANPACDAAITTNTTLTADIGPCSGEGLEIGSNLTLNCAGHTISGVRKNNDGVILEGTEATVKNCIVKGFFDGFYLSGSSNTNTLTGNTATGNYDGFLIASFSNTLTGNTANNNREGFALYDSSDTLTGNTASSNKDDGFYLSGTYSDTLTGNTANSNTHSGFFIHSSSSNTLTGNTANGNKYGFVLYSSTKNTLTKNTANSNSAYGYNDNTSGYFMGVPHWGTANSYGTTIAALSTTGDKGTGNGHLAGGNPNISSATSPF